MKKILLSALSMLLALIAAVPASGAVEPTFYAATLHELNGNPAGFIYNDGKSDQSVFKGAIDPADPAVTMRCGANCNGTYYGLLYKDNKPVRFVTVDWANGKTTDVATLAADYPLFTDLAYNFKTKKLYAILPGDSQTDVYEITDLKTAASTKVATISLKARAFEFGLDGTMYVLSSEAGSGYGEDALLTSFDADFKQLKKMNISDDWSDKLQIYDYGTYNIHSLEFDHINNRLYWTNTDSQQQFLYYLDPATAKRQSGVMLAYDVNYSANADAVSLYIPFDMPDGGLSSAAAVSELAAKADSKGANVDTLTWVNPSVNFGGEALDGLYSVRIYRNSVSDDNLIKELTDGLTVGGKMTWVDENATEGNNTYVVVPCRVKDEKGLSASVSVYVGFDIPMSVGSVSLTKVDKGIEVKWEAPKNTVNGGVLDTATLKYDVLRLPDSVVVAKDTTVTTLVDEAPLASWQHYSYEITPKTAKGAGDKSTGGANIYAGPDFTAPYETSFDDYDANNMWGNINVNNDGFNGYFDSYSGMFTISAVYYNYDENQEVKKNLNTYIISPDIKLEAGRYKVTVESYIKSTGTSNNFTVNFGKGATVEAQTNKIKSFEYTAAADEQTDVATAEFEVTEDGKYNFSVNLTGPKLENDYEHSTIGISAFKLEKVEPVAQKFNVTGVVTDDTDKAVEGAEVTVSAGEQTFTAKTDAEGKFTVEAEGLPGTYDVKVAKDGYEEATTSFKFEGEDINLGTIVIKVVSGISAAGTDATAVKTSVYDLSGRLVKTLKHRAGDKLNLNKGVYIINGRKVVVK